MINLKNERCFLKALLSIITLGYVVVTVMFLMFFDNTGNQSKMFYNVDSTTVSDSKMLYSDTRRHDHYKNTNDNSKLGKLNNGYIQKVIYPVNVKKRKKIDLCKKTFDMQANRSADPEMNATHIKGLLMESIHVNYTRNIYFSVKTTHNNFNRRLFPLMLTWLQLVDKNKVRQL